MDKNVISCLVWYANASAKGVLCGNSWPDTFVRDYNKQIATQFWTTLAGSINFVGMSEEEAEELGFYQYEEGSTLWLFPLWLVPMIPENLTVFNVNGEKFKYKREKAAITTIGVGFAPFGLTILPRAKIQLV